jgi:cyclophilin family peptidyl-prolyl cis-trans isomerase
MEAARKRRTRMRQGGVLAALVVAVVAIVLITSIGGGKSKSSQLATTGSSTTSTAPTSTTTPASTTAAGSPPVAPDQTGGTLSKWACPNPDGSSPHILHFPSTPPPMCIDPAKTYTVTETTNMGNIQFTLDTKTTPKTANNFAVLAWYHYYDGTSIDRIDNTIDIEQSGSPSTQSISDPGPGYNIPDEPTMSSSSGQLSGPYKYSPGNVVMARGSGANSGSAQYFFVYGSAASALNSQGTYVTFGQVTPASLTVLQKIASLYQACPASDQSCLGGVPSKVVLISKVTVTAS